jgi:arylsulfatase A-like enzyme
VIHLLARFVFTARRDLPALLAGRGRRWGDRVPALLVAASALSGCSRPDASPVPRDAGALSASSPVATVARAAPVAPVALPEPPFNVVLVTIDSLRADMPWAGYPRPIAPRLEELHRHAVDYPHAYSVSSFTSKSLAALVSGRYPSELARTGVFFTQYLRSNAMVCESLSEAGVPCVAAMAHAYLAKGYAGFDQGFRDWRLVPGITFDFNTDPYVTSDKLTPLAIEMLSDRALTAAPFFAWFHFMDPHDKYQAHDGGPHFGARPRDLYDEEVFYTDAWVGKLIDFVQAQPWGARTVIVVSADHGEAFGEHHEFRHGHELYEELVHVPLFFLVPGRTEARTIEATRSQIDLAPTIVELLGQTPAALPGLQGRSFARELLGGEPGPARDVVCDLPRDDWDERRRSLLHDGFKLIAFGDDTRFELYDLGADPGEQTDLYWKRRDVANDMLRRYHEACRAIEDVAPAGGIPSHDGGPPSEPRGRE